MRISTLTKVGNWISSRPDRKFFDVLRRRLRPAPPEIPAAPLGVVWRTPWEDASGYAEEGRCFTRAMARSDRTLRLEPIAWNRWKVAIASEQRALFGALQSVPRPDWFLAVTNCIPTYVKPVRGAALNILRTTYETDRVPDNWLRRLDRFDEVWVISNYNRESFIRSGVAAEKIRVVPSCVDTELFAPEGPRCALPAPCTGRFTFLTVFDWQQRKGWDVLLRAYVRAFAPDDGTALLLKVSRIQGQNPSEMRRQAEAVLAEARTSLAERPDLVWLEELLEAPAMAALYRSVDAFVLPSRGEGWGRPYMEAMACGRPTIATAASGNLDFMTPENSVLVPATSVLVSERAAREFAFFRGQRWFEPDEAALCLQLRRIRQDPELRRSLGTAAAAAVQERFTLESAQRNLSLALAAAEARWRASAHGVSSNG